MKIYIIRHAQAEHNLSGNVSLYDPEITELGINQCFVGKEKYIDATMVLSSTSTRALQTSTLLFDNIPFYATDLLLEYQTGVPCNARNSLDIQKNKFKNFNFDTYYTDEILKEITWLDGEKRAKKLIELIKTINTPVLAIVSHANFIRNIMSLLKGYNSDELNNCHAYTIFLNI